MIVKTTLQSPTHYKVYLEGPTPGEIRYTSYVRNVENSRSLFGHLAEFVDVAKGLFPENDYWPDDGMLMTWLVGCYDAGVWPKTLTVNGAFNIHIEPMSEDQFDSINKFRIVPSEKNVVPSDIGTHIAG